MVLLDHWQLQADSFRQSAGFVFLTSISGRSTAASNSFSLKTPLSAFFHRFPGYSTALPPLPVDIGLGHRVDLLPVADGGRSAARSHLLVALEVAPLSAARQLHLLVTLEVGGLGAGRQGAAVSRVDGQRLRRGVRLGPLIRLVPVERDHLLRHGANVAAVARPVSTQRSHVIYGDVKDFVFGLVRIRPLRSVLTISEPWDEGDGFQ